MKKFIIAAAAAAFGLGLASSANAQSINIDLDQLTTIDGDQVGSFVNIAVNNAAIDGSVDVQATATAFLQSTAETSTGATASSQAAIQNALGDVETTVIGAANQGEIVTGVASTVDDAVAGSASASSDYIGPLLNANTANLAFNQAELTANASLVATNAALDASAVSTTAIGAANTGSIISGVQGTLSDVSVSVP